jgi:hypothetical protein
MIKRIKLELLVIYRGGGTDVRVSGKISIANTTFKI